MLPTLPRAEAPAAQLPAASGAQCLAAAAAARGYHGKAAAGLSRLGGYLPRELQGPRSAGAVMLPVKTGAQAVVTVGAWLRSFGVVSL